MNANRDSSAVLLGAVLFAGQKHRLQKRKDGVTPYINHPIAVAELLARAGGVTDAATLLAAVLHDTIEDTETTAAELEGHFGAEVRSLVQEVTDDKSLPKAERKQLQIEHAPLLTTKAQQIKIADKICNLEDISDTQPVDWTMERKREYLDWAERVVAGCRGCNAKLEAHFDAVLKQRREALG
jgi:guanosine-3',5'-bis(diphosphate) 3'-pyrophosphohydrolase